MTFLTNTLLNLRILFTPSYWIQNESYNSLLDKKLIALLETERFVNITVYKASIGGIELWIANHPYASFTKNGVGRPSRKTIYKAYQKLAESILNDAEKSTYWR